MIIDVHQHFWRLDRGDYVYPPPGDAVLYRDYMPADLAPVLQRHGIGRTVLVQATDTVAESRFLLELAHATPSVAGVVGWWDARTEELLEELLAAPFSPLLVGVRPMLQRFDDVAWLGDPATLRTLRRLPGLGLVLDALVDTRHLEPLVALAAGVPDLKVAINHMAKPWRLPARFGEWEQAMRRLGQLPNCWVKLSGFPFAGTPADPALAYDRLVAALRRWFPLERLVWGSDWPVIEKEGGHARALAAFRSCFTEEEAGLVLSGNAAKLYDLERRQLPLRRLTGTGQSDGIEHE